MKNYKEPKMDVIEFETEDIIQTSGLNLGESTTVGGSGGIFVPTSLDEKY